MEISKEALEKFKRIYEKEYGERISDDEALEMAQRVLLFFSLIYRPLPCREDNHFDSIDDDL